MTGQKREELAMVVWVFAFVLSLGALLGLLRIFIVNLSPVSILTMSPVSTLTMWIRPILGFGLSLFSLLFFLLKRYAKRRLVYREKEYPWEKELEFQPQFLLRKLAGMRIPECAQMFLFSVILFTIAWLR